MSLRRRLFIAFGVIAMSTAALGFVALTAPSLGAAPAGDRLERMATSSRFEDGKFQNLVPTATVKLSDTWAMIKAYATNDAEVEPSVELPVLTPDDLRPIGDDRLRITWMGHSSMLIEIDGRLLLTDPVWGPRASPFSFSGPARFHPTPVALKDLPPLDAVVISHDHYDHLDYPSILELADSDVPFIVPLGLGAHLEAWGIAAERITELDWWEEADVAGLRLVSTPARHFSGRGFERDRTLWSSWAFIGEHHRAWFSGDTGPAPFFDEIGERLGPFDATMIEVGAWNALWGEIHLGPDAAIKVHEQVRGKTFIPVHWGTFNLALHAWDEPIVRLQQLADAHDFTLAAPVVGGTIDPDDAVVDDFWKGRLALAQR